MMIMNGNTPGFVGQCIATDSDKKIKILILLYFKKTSPQLAILAQLLHFPLSEKIFLAGIQHGSHVQTACSITLWLRGSYVT
ncbi:hypothetical protein HA49_14980 [Tatumella morbirosei]|uniref:Uncharacterized protein n=1 Tax=Tatumella morbirosei TaxID=642227 RepID=A0A095T6F6_9GAMM|nr:hypothetical protein HA49_14980 [Tatumella morbirosei]